MSPIQADVFAIILPPPLIYHQHLAPVLWVDRRKSNCYWTTRMGLRLDGLFVRPNMRPDDIAAMKHTQKVTGI